jgi:hypothetical protein
MNVVRDMCARLAMAATVHARAGSACSASMTRPMFGSIPARNHPGVLSAEDAHARSIWIYIRSRMREIITAAPGVGSLRSLASMR